MHIHDSADPWHQASWTRPDSPESFLPWETRAMAHLPAESAVQHVRGTNRSRGDKPGRPSMDTRTRRNGLAPTNLLRDGIGHVFRHRSASCAIRRYEVFLVSSK